MLMLIDGGPNKNGPIKSSGFTIVELMIALTVLSTILLLSTIVLITIGALYSKGVNAASLQNTTRTIAADLTSSLQFSGNDPSGCNYEEGGITCATGRIPKTAGGTPYYIYSFCINTTRYSYVLNKEMGNDSGSTPPNLVTNHVLWRDTMKNNSSCPPLDIAAAIVQTDSMSAEGAGNSKGYDMVSDHMRLTRFKVKQDPPSSGIYKIETWLAFGDTDLLNLPANGAATCKGGTGNQFCGTSALTTSVKRRLQ